MKTTAARYNHKSVTARMAIIREHAEKTKRVPTLRTVCSLLDLPPLSAEGYLRALDRECDQVRTMTQQEVGAALGLGRKAVLRRAMTGELPAKKTNKGWAFDADAVELAAGQKPSGASA